MTFDRTRSELTDALIEAITGIEPGTDNHALCLQFAESNFNYHRFVSVEERDIDRSIKGLVEKFRIRDRDVMADSLEACMQRLFAPSLVKIKDSLYPPIIRYDMLALFLALSDNPLAVNYTPSTTLWTRLPPKPLTWKDIIREEPLTGDHWSRLESDSDEDGEDDVLFEDFELELDGNGLVNDGGLAEKKLRKQKKQVMARAQQQQFESHSELPPSHYHQMYVDFEPPVDRDVMRILTEKQYWCSPSFGSGFVSNRDDFGTTTAEAPTLLVHQSRDRNIRFLDPQRQQYLDEIDAVREICFMLRGHAGVLFDRHEWDVGGDVGGGRGWEGLGIVEGMFTVKPKAIVQHLTESTLKNLLSEFCEYGNWVTRSRELVRCLCAASPTLYGQTCQAFASAVNEMLVKFEERIARLEAEFGKFAKRSEGNDTVVSLLRLKNLLSADLELFRLVGRVVSDTLVLEAASTPPSGYPPISPIPPARLTVSLLTGLYDQILLAQAVGQQEAFTTLRRLFDYSIEPYGRMIDRWIFEGNVDDDCANEFFVVRNLDIPEDSPQYWHEGFRFRSMEAGSVPEEPEADDIDQELFTPPYPSFLEPFATKILFAGKAVNMLLSLKLGDVNMKVYSNPHTRWEALEWTNIHASMRSAAANSITTAFTDGFKGYTALTTAHFPMLGDMILKKSTIHGASALASRRGSKRQSVRITHAISTAPTLESVMSMAREYGRENGDAESQTDVRVSDAFSLYHHEVNEHLDNYVRPQYESAGRLLANVLMSRCDLAYHFRALAGIYLMLEGDLMHRFCQMVFHKMDKRQAWYDSQTLNGLFMEACRHTEWERQDNVHIWVKERENLQKRTVAAAVNRNGHRDGRISGKSSSVDLNSVRVFENVVVEYRLPWPINNIIRAAAIHQYKKFITLVLELKRAKCLMERIALFKSRLHHQAARNRRDPAILLFYSLRVRLMWFINTVYNYIMTTILHAETQAFQEKLAQVFDVDEIIQLHEEYVRRIRDRCLLNEKAIYIMRAIVLVLDATIRFSNLFARYVEDPAAKSFVITQQSIRFWVAPRVDSDDEESDGDSYDEEDQDEEEDGFWKGLNEIDREFKRASDFVTTSLRVIARSGGFAWFEALAASLSA
ncbi:Spc98 family-domain-containing protein [Jimgerdemannia flammicorona]|uniref:Spc98 family-domain-containing protein n=1 Tax=Jimgerdemannia flammicorona TaxID=994334 RepID=A0A433QCL4_9FUNG|nr:Spc98 family-domain-containing protein [Jimgerdemannia flammicorona]